MQVNMLEAKTQLSKLVEAALRGEEVVIANRGRPVVKLVKADGPVRRKAGAWAGLMSDEQLEVALSPETETESTRLWLESVLRPIDGGLRPAPTSTGKAGRPSKAARALR
jgi:prevent-host-death family protein